MCAGLRKKGTQRKHFALPGDVWGIPPDGTYFRFLLLTVVVADCCHNFLWAFFFVVVVHVVKHSTVFQGLTE